jgi:hypothetical protein
MAFWRPLMQKEKPQNEAGEAKGPLSPPDLTDPTDQRLDNLAPLIAPGLVIEGKIEGDRSRAHCGPLQGKGLYKG